MYKQNRKGWSKHFDFFCLDVILIEIAFFLSYAIRHDWIFFYNMNYYRRAGVMIALISICVGMFREEYHGVLRRDSIEELKNVIVHVTIVEIALIAITFFMKDLFYSREVFVFFWFFGSLICFIGRSIWKQFLHRKMQLNKDKRQVLVVTTSKRAENIIEKLINNEFSDFVVVGIIFTDKDEKGKEVKGYPILGRLTTEPEYIHENVVDEVFVHLDPGEFLDRKYIDFFLQVGLTVHFDLDGLAEFDHPAYIENFADRKVITSSMKIASPGKLFIKRMMDIMED